MPHTRRSKYAVVHTLGCKVNQAEGASLAKFLEDRGYILDGAVEAPDLVVILTCAVTAKAEGKSRRAVGRFAAAYPGARIVVTGCLAETHPKAFASLSNALVLGAYEKERPEEFLRDAGAATIVTGAHNCREFASDIIASTPGRTRQYLKIQDGCSQRCSYCVVPLARGPARSRLPDDTILGARGLAEEGAAEIVLTGIHLGSYGSDFDPPMKFSSLLARVLREVPGPRFRLSSIEPQEIDDELIELLRADTRVCRHLHMPLQSGSDRILARMGRPYDSAFICRMTERLYKAAADICIGMDVMVAFPGETEADFEETRRTLQEVNPAYLHVFPFSPRPGTPAADFPDRIHPKVARERVAILREWSDSRRALFYAGFLGQEREGLVESRAETDRRIVRTDNYIPVEVPASQVKANDRFLLVRIEAVDADHVSGCVVNPERSGSVA